MTDFEAMNLAISLAKLTIGQTSPNPSVGAVVTKNGMLLATGHHLVAGANHAEINAFRMINKEELAGATLYVTLEPCCHVGKTGACVDEIIKNKISRVVVATIDKNPIVLGKGVKTLREAGIEVEVGLCEDEAKRIYEPFFYFVNSGLPFITIKSGLSLDGKSATIAGESKWITSEEARKDAHYYRGTHDAILVGKHTIINDDPLLTCRTIEGCRQPIRIVLDTNLELTDSYQIINNPVSKTIIITGSCYNQNRAKDLLGKYHHLELIHLSTQSINLTEAMVSLAKRNITSILVEGGNKVQNSFLENLLFNQIVLYVAPKLLGGSTAPAFFNGNGFARLNQALALEFTEVDRLATDIKIVAKPVY